jgi:uncharacterized protein YndB with AHSA1/START domain
MSTFHITIHISRPPAEVFAFVADPHNMPAWYEAVDHVTKTTNGPNGPGAQYHVTRTLPGGQAHNDIELTEHQPNRRVTLESLNGPTPFRYSYALEPAGPRTRLTLEGRISSAGLPGPMGQLDGVATQLFKRGMRQNLNQLKRIVEAS